MSQKELDMLTSVADGASSEGLKFWATFTVKVLSDWGVSTSVWFRGCQCSHQTEKEQKQCPLKGRTGIKLACGAWKSFIEDLNKLTLNKDALLAISKLEVLPGGQTFSAFLQRCFQDCKNKMELRARHAWTFWGDLPFSILELGRHYVDKTIDEGWSRRRALELISNFDSCQSKTSLGAVSWVFFGDAVNRAHMFSWAQNGKPLAEHLRHLLLGYCTSLTVMQRLEARHHLVNLSLSRGRALSVPGVISSLRRRANEDLTNPSFRASLQDLLNNVDQLVPEQWDSQKQLLEIVYGHGLDQLHPDTTWEEQQMQRIADQTLQSPPSSRLATCQSCSFVLAFQKITTVVWQLVVFQSSIQSSEIWYFCWAMSFPHLRQSYNQNTCKQFLEVMMIRRPEMCLPFQALPGIPHSSISSSRWCPCIQIAAATSSVLLHWLRMTQAQIDAVGGSGRGEIFAS